MSILTSITTTSFQSANSKATGSVTYDEATFKKAGTLIVGYGANQISFNTVTDYLIFVNEVIVPLTDKIHLGGDASSPFTVGNSGVPGPEPITD